MPGWQNKQEGYKEQMKSRNIILIGMPGVGKSTVGVVLAKMLGFRFLDSDLVIQERHGRLLYELIEDYGAEGFWELENDVNRSLITDKTVIATGGSAVYGEEAMKHLEQIGIIVYLEISYDELKVRLGDLNRRGVTIKPGQDLKDLYEERCALYEKYAQLTVSCEGKGVRAIAEEICYGHQNL